jgi:hypothetical protein
MPYFLGTDEAGYGPNLGPLVVSVSAWRTSEPLDGESLYERLGGTIVRRPSEASAERLAVADSKILYNAGKGLHHLERGLLSALATLGRPATDWAGIWAALDGRGDASPQPLPWHEGYTCRLPVDAAPGEIGALAAALARAFDATGVRLGGLASRAVFPAEFNALCRRYDSKGLALSNLTLGLLAETISGLGREPIHVVCDKHGGRDRYAALLAEHFPESFVEVHGESRERSTYRLGPSDRRIEITFAVGAESYLPTALASMASKYLRELAMRAFNAFWTARVEGLRPTAGYPVDARRFKDAIAAQQAVLGIDDDVLWRVK